MVKSFGFTLRVLLFSLAILLPTLSHAQTIQDDSLAQQWFFPGVGADSIDYLSQSFNANVNVITQFAVWLDEDQPNSLVQLLLCGDDGNGNANVANPLYRSPPIAPPGGWHTESGLSQNVFIGQKYWIVVEGVGVPGATGYAIVGTSFEWTDANEHMYSSVDSGATWTRLFERIAIDVRGEICSTTVSITPPMDTLEVCTNGSIQLNAGADYTEYSWSNGTMDQFGVFTDLDQGEQSVKVVDSLGCLGIDSVFLILYPVARPNIGFDTLNICDGQSVVFFAGLGFVHYEWNTGDTFDIIIADSSGLYIVDATDENNCVGSDSVELIVNPLDTILLGPDTSFCQGGSILLSAEGPYRNWVWSNGATSPTVNAMVSGEYFVIFNSLQDCPGKSDSIIVEVFPLPDQPMISLSESQLATDSLAGYQWYLEGLPLTGITDRQFVPTLSGNYEVEIFDSNGCSTRSDPFALNLDSESLVIPEGFSPNEDGLNDAWIIDQIFFYPEAELIVMNRWGNEVYKSEGYENEWKGTNTEGKALVDGTYFYILDLKNGTLPYQGPVYIKR